MSGNEIVIGNEITPDDFDSFQRHTLLSEPIQKSERWYFWYHKIKQLPEEYQVWIRDVNDEEFTKYFNQGCRFHKSRIETFNVPRKYLTPKAESREFSFKPVPDDLIDYFKYLTDEFPEMHIPDCLAMAENHKMLEYLIYFAPDAISVNVIIFWVSTAISNELYDTALIMLKSIKMRKESHPTDFFNVSMKRWGEPYPLHEVSLKRNQFALGRRFSEMIPIRHELYSYYIKNTSMPCDYFDDDSDSDSDSYSSDCGDPSCKSCDRYH